MSEAMLIDFITDENVGTSDWRHSVESWLGEHPEVNYRTVRRFMRAVRALTAHLDEVRRQAQRDWLLDQVHEREAYTGRRRKLARGKVKA